MCNQQIDEQKLHYLQTDLINIDLNPLIAVAIKDNFYKSVDKNKYEITKIKSIQNKVLWNRYCETKQRLIKFIGEENKNEMYLWHKYDDSMIHILYQGLRKEYNNGPLVY